MHFKNPNIHLNSKNDFHLNIQGHPHLICMVFKKRFKPHRERLWCVREEGGRRLCSALSSNRACSGNCSTHVIKRQTCKSIFMLHLYVEDYMSIKFSRITVTFSALWWINCVQLFDSCSELPIIKTKALVKYSRYTFVHVGWQP